MSAKSNNQDGKHFSDELNAKIKDRLTIESDILLGERCTGAIATVAGYWLVVFVTSFLKEHKEMTVITGLVFSAIIGIRIYEGRKLRERSIEPELKKWIRKKYYFWTIVGSLAWAYFICLSFYYYSYNWVSFAVVVGTIGYASGTAMTLASDFKLAIAYAFCMVIPTLLCFLVLGTNIGIPFAILILFFLVFTYTACRISYTSFCDTVINTVIIEEQRAEQRELVTVMRGHANMLHTSSIDLSNLSGEMSRDANDMFLKTNNVTSFSEELNTNTDAMVTEMKRFTGNVNSTASAIEEMTVTINNIEENTTQASMIAKDALAQAVTTNQDVEQLGMATQEIGAITNTINEISEQTNLLALNATIEAARAGDAGKGFAVVANEIKELSRQTAEATLKIRSQINEIQSSMMKTIKNITTISDNAKKVDEVVGLIASAVGEQSVTTKDISKLVWENSQGINDVNKMVTDSSASIEKISEDIYVVNQSASKIVESNKSVDSNIKKLLGLFEELNKLTDKETSF